MENILERMEKIKLLSDMFENANFFNDKIDNNLKNIEHELDNISKIASEYLVINDIVGTIKKDQRRQKIIWKILFPYYWKITQQINCFNDEEFDKFETILSGKKI